jgi:hypothetical protein
VTGVSVVGVPKHLVAVEAHVGRGLPSGARRSAYTEGRGRPPRPIVRPGWRSPAGLYLDDPLEGFGLSAEDSAVLHAIMLVGSRERLEFLG